MKYVKMLALAAVAAGALMAFVGAGTASASKLCSTTTDPCGSSWANSTLNFTLTAGTTALLKEVGAGGETLNTCTGSTVKGPLTNGTSTATAKGTVEAKNLTWTGCQSTTNTTAGGTLEIHKITGTSNGTVTGSGFKVTVLVFGFITCVFETGEGGHLGTLTEGKPGVFHAEATVLKVSGFGCPEKAEWNATYTLTEPKETTASVSAS
jgi:hypothetical protein